MIQPFDYAVLLDLIAKTGKTEEWSLLHTRVKRIEDAEPFAVVLLAMLLRATEDITKETDPKKVLNKLLAKARIEGALAAAITHAEDESAGYADRLKIRIRNVQDDLPQTDCTGLTPDEILELLQPEQLQEPQDDQKDEEDSDSPMCSITDDTNSERRRAVFKKSRVDK